jgi:AcrR family transcriptional regulator
MASEHGDLAIGGAHPTGQQPPSRPPSSSDGRRARRDRNRLRVLDAVIELFAQDQLLPSTPAVAERSEVSLRSIYRYFEDQEALLRAAITHHFEQMEPLATVPGLGEGPLEQRIERLVTARLRLYRAVGPTARAARASAGTSDILRQEVAGAQHALLRQVERHFAPELQHLDPAESRAVLNAVDALCQLGAIDHLDVDRRLPDEVIHDTLVRALRRLLAER